MREATYADGFPDDIDLKVLLRPGNHLVEIDGFWAAYFGQVGLLEIDEVGQWFHTTDEQTHAINGLVSDQATWYQIVVPLGAEREPSVVYRSWNDDPGIDYVLSTPGAVGSGTRLAAAEGSIIQSLDDWTQVRALIHGDGPQPSSLSLAERTLLLIPTYLANDPDPSARRELADALAQIPYVRDAHTLADALLDPDARSATSF